MVAVPFIINLYNSLEVVITGSGTILIILVLCLLFAWVLMKIPSIPIKRIGKINISITLAKGLGALLLVFILEPLVFLIVSEDFHSLGETAADPYVMEAIWLSMSMAFLATVASVILGVPLGYLLARRDFLGRALIQGIVDVPIVMPHLISGIALLMVFGIHGIIGAPLAELGIRFVDAWPGIVVAMMFVSVPFVVNSARDGFAAVDPRLENVGRSLGATRLQAFSKIALRLNVKPIISGGIMAWARGISEFGAIIIIAYYPMVAPTLIYDRFTSFGLLDARPIAVLLILICLAVFIILRFLVETGSKRIKTLSFGGKP